MGVFIHLIQNNDQIYLFIIFYSGGCDGCIDKDKPNNAGLEPFVKALEPTFKRYENILTRCHQTRIVDSSHQQNVEI